MKKYEKRKEKEKEEETEENTNEPNVEVSKREYQTASKKKMERSFEFNGTDFPFIPFVEKIRESDLYIDFVEIHATGIHNVTKLVDVFISLDDYEALIHFTGQPVYTKSQLRIIRAERNELIIEQFKQLVENLKWIESEEEAGLEQPKYIDWEELIEQFQEMYMSEMTQEVTVKNQMVNKICLKDEQNIIVSLFEKMAPGYLESLPILADTCFWEEKPDVSFLREEVAPTGTQNDSVPSPDESSHVSDRTTSNTMDTMMMMLHVNDPKKLQEYFEHTKCESKKNKNTNIYT